MPWWNSTSFSKLSLESPSRKKKCLSSTSGRSSSIDTAASSSSNSHWRSFLPLQSRRKHPSNLPGLDVAISRTQFSSSEVSPETTPSSLSPSSLERSLVRGSPGVPQPLPLPESAVYNHRDGKSGIILNGNLGNHPLPAPKEASSRVPDDRHNDKEKFDALSGDVRNSLREYQRRAVRPRSEGKFEEDCRGTERTPDKLRPRVPVKSAPTSPISSPMLSPQRMAMGGMFPPQHPIQQGFQAWSAPEMTSLDVSFGVLPFALSEKFGYNAENSPLPSPPTRTPSPNLKSPGRPISPLHPKASQEVPVNVHPLPLPPRAASPTQQGPASQLSNQWQKGKLIGRGTFGSVYMATNRETGALCAMKEVEILHDDPNSAECIKQLQQEIKVLSKLKHPNIVQYYGSEIVGDRFYIYLEYVYPGSINKYVREHCGAITESVVRNFTRHILSGLAYLHSTKTIHRDIKGANLLVDPTGVVKLADFGMAKHLNGQTADLSLKGSPYWMAPELMQSVIQKDNNVDVAFAVDTWSLGCTIIEMLNGKPPWSEYEGAAAMFKVLRESPAIPESLSSEGKDFLHCCFRRNPADRPSTIKLLEHPFLKNSHHFDAPTHVGRPRNVAGRAKSHKERPNITSSNPNVAGGLHKPPSKSLGIAHYFSPLRLIRSHEMKLMS